MTRAPRLLVAAGFVAWALWAVAVALLFQGEEDLRDTGTRTVGVVTAVHDDGSGRDAEVRFVDRAGRTWEVDVDTSDVDDVLEPNDEVAIVYDPADPNRALLADQSKEGQVAEQVGRDAAHDPGAGRIVWLLLYLLKPTRPNGQVAG